MEKIEKRVETKQPANKRHYSNHFNGFSERN